MKALNKLYDALWVAAPEKTHRITLAHDWEVAVGAHSSIEVNPSCFKAV